MMFLETWLVYPIPSLSWGDWRPKGFEYEDVNFQSADGTKLHGWFVPNPNAARAVVYCHGNGEDVASVGELAAHLGNVLQASVFIFDYRGYGHSEGRPNEAGCIADGCAAQKWLANRVGIQPNEVVLIGRSLGSAVAIAMAAENGARALVLECAFPNMPDLAARLYPWLPVGWVMKNRYDCVSRIQQFSGPIFQSHGTADSLAPIDLARTLFDAATTRDKTWVEFDKLGHNDAPPRIYYQQLAAFLNKEAPPTGGVKPQLPQATEPSK
jgi:fermentation-respiration switch protein FrsA (DUF1100 family)